MSQKQHVSRLIDLAITTEQASHQNWTKVCVFYDRDLEWLEDEGRYALIFPPQDRTGVYAWLADHDLLDLLESPTLILVICNDYDESGLSDEIVDEIKQLRSVQQIWLVDTVDENDLTTHEDIKHLFPGLITESPH